MGAQRQVKTPPDVMAQRCGRTVARQRGDAVEAERRCLEQSPGAIPMVSTERRNRVRGLVAAAAASRRTGTALPFQPETMTRSARRSKPRPPAVLAGLA